MFGNFPRNYRPNFELEYDKNEYGYLTENQYQILESIVNDYSKLATLEKVASVQNVNTFYVILWVKKLNKQIANFINFEYKKQLTKFSETLSRIENQVLSTTVQHPIDSPLEGDPLASWYPIKYSDEEIENLKLINEALSSPQSEKVPPITPLMMGSIGIIPFWELFKRGDQL